jgi:hypothetical protein
MAGQAANDNVHYRIGMVSAFFIVSTAVVLDAVGFLLMLTGLGEIVTEFIGICGSVIFFLWFLFLGTGFMSGKASSKLGVMGAGALIEAIPFLNGVSPTFVIETVSLILITRKEDREKAAEEQEKRAKSVATTQQNQNRVAQNAARRSQMMQEAGNDDESLREAA